MEAINRLARLAIDSVKSDRGRWQHIIKFCPSTDVQTTERERETAERDREKE
jgi:hypothetical protein